MYLASYRIVGKFGKFGKSSVIRQTKTIQISTYKYNLLAESIHLPNFFCQMLKMSKFTKLSHYVVYTIENFFPQYCNSYATTQKFLKNYF